MVLAGLFLDTSASGIPGSGLLDKPGVLREQPVRAGGWLGAVKLSIKSVLSVIPDLWTYPTPWIFDHMQVRAIGGDLVEEVALVDSFTSPKNGEPLTTPVP